MRVSTQVCTASDRKIQMPQICILSCHFQICIPEASRILRRCIADASGMLREIKFIEESSGMHRRTFGDASAMHRRSFFQTKPRECIAKNFNACIEFSCSTRDVSRCLMTSPMHRRSIAEASAMHRGIVRDASRCQPITKK